MRIATPGARVLAAHLDGEAVLLDLVSKDYFRLNETSALIWRSIDRGDDRAAVIAALVAEFEVSDEDAGAAVDDFVRELERRGLLASR